MHWRRKWQPTPVFLPGESLGWGSLVGHRLWGCTESDTTEYPPDLPTLLQTAAFPQFSSLNNILCLDLAASDLTRDMQGLLLQHSDSPAVACVLSDSEERGIFVP